MNILDSFMLLFFTFIAPLGCLVLSSLWSFELTAKLSLLLLSYRLILLLITLFLPRLWVCHIYSNNICCVGYLVLPDLSINIYTVILDWLAPVLIILESFQSVNVILATRQTLLLKTLDSSYDVPVKVFMIIASIFCYLFSLFIVVSIFKSDKLTIVSSSFLSIICTLLVVLIPLMMVVEEATIMDVSFITFYVSLQALTWFQTIYDANNVLFSNSTFNHILKLLSIILSVVILVSLPILFGRTSMFSSDSSFGDFDESDFKETWYQFFHIYLVTSFKQITPRLIYK
ncbi:hypothetical protein DFA_08845 [Cavenderia fasciculata]|uniref:Transmembrane protein n=1 Tax=Cavenderia fasciculata TaxID=261658 RepID=F4Q4J5_CACFS|nr:uncharacterized protein DFA_08845 [Cavenderia fasciculata]EGG17844.1 hypothetical protein DFA_08845 [Cavenderia fasciculata]|eukprot:XP_004356328.1 hypothetical protein DFA_08845 [Cavenderia fasciculata]